MVDLENFKEAYELAFKKDYIIDLASYLHEIQPEQNNYKAKAISVSGIFSCRQNLIDNIFNFFSFIFLLT